MKRVQLIVGLVMLGVFIYELAILPQDLSVRRAMFVDLNLFLGVALIIQSRSR